MSIGITGVASLNRDDARGREDTLAIASSFDGSDAGYEPAGWSEVASWRRSARQRLIQKRMSMTAKERDAKSARIASSLDNAVGRLDGRTLGVYWPFKGEPNLYPWIHRVVEAGATVALPVVIRKGWPLEFRQWRPGDALERGIWNIPIPSRGPPAFPHVIVAPMVGFDGCRFRLGYGGGFYDRTLAATTNRPYVIGVGYADGRLETIHPQPHDIRMDMVVTDA